MITRRTKPGSVVPVAILNPAVDLPAQVLVTEVPITSEETILFGVGLLTLLTRGRGEGGGLPTGRSSIIDSREGYLYLI